MDSVEASQQKYNQKLDLINADYSNYKEKKNKTLTQWTILIKKKINFLLTITTERFEAFSQKPVITMTKAEIQTKAKTES